jgi:hypothetical protein
LFSRTNRRTILPVSFSKFVTSSLNPLEFVKKSSGLYFNNILTVQILLLYGTLSHLSHSLLPELCHFLKGDRIHPSSNLQFSHFTQSKSFAWGLNERVPR